MLPQLREDIVVYPGPANFAGEPSWTVHDPARNSFFRIDWLTFEILNRWSFGDPEVIAAQVNAQSPLNVTGEDVSGVARFLTDRELIKSNFAGSAGFLNERLKQRKQSWWQWLMHHYLFIRIPLVRPDAWLTRHVDKVRFLASGLFLKLTIAALVFGLWEAVRQWDEIRSALVDTFTPSGALAYGVTMILVKVAHELGHAFTAKHYGCRVPTMGLAFLVLWPVAYTDTTDTWKLDDRRKRLRVACAGVATELTIAAWATAALPLLPDGPLRTVVFLLATTTWVSAVVVNFNPLMRFDGYFILSDWLDLPNLHDRAFALARWRIRRLLLGMDEPPPESFPPSTQRILIALAVVTWIYRLGLYIGIAVLVYHFTIKLVGILLFVVEMWFFIIGPIAREMKQWWARRDEWRGSRRSKQVAWGLAIILCLFVLPLPAPVGSTAVFSPQQVHVVYAPEAGRLTALPTRPGERFARGEVVATIESPAVSGQQEVALARVEGLRQQVAAAGFDPSLQPQLMSLQAELQAAEADLANNAEQAGRLELRAPFAGRLADVDPDLRPGDWVPKGAPIAVVAGGSRWQVVAYVEAEDAARLKVGDRARFTPQNAKVQPIGLVVDQIDADATRALPSALFAASSGGDVLVRQQEGRLTPERAVYRVRLSAPKAPEKLEGHTWRGKVVIQGDWSSPGWRYLRAAIAVLVRESGF